MKAADWDRRYADAELVWTAEPNRFVVTEVADIAPGVALDLAAGEGRNTVWLAEQGWDATAVDYSTVALEKAKKLAAHRGVTIAVHAADLMTYEPEPGRFDLVVVAYLHLPWADMQQILSRGAAAVAPGGTLLVIGHDADNLEHGWGGPQSPTVLYRAGKIAEMLTGFEIKKAERIDRPVETDNGTKCALDCLVRARRPD